MTNRPRPRLLVREALTGHSLPALWQRLTFSQYGSIPKKALTSVCVCTGILLIGIHNIMLLIPALDLNDGRCVRLRQGDLADARSEEHTSELQTLMRISYAVFCLKKKQQHNATSTSNHQTPQ